MRINIKSFVISFFILGLFSSSMAGPIYEEFKKRQADIQKLRYGQSSQKRQLDYNLYISIKRALKRWFDYADSDKIKASDLTYEKSGHHELTFYVKYKEFIGYFTYHSDPSIYFVLPIQEKLILPPGVQVKRNDSLLNPPPDAKDAPNTKVENKKAEDTVSKSQ